MTQCLCKRWNASLLAVARSGNLDPGAVEGSRKSSAQIAARTTPAVVQLRWLDMTGASMAENHAGVLQGLDAPPGNGLVIEVHLDMMEAPVKFLQRLKACGFEDDPFLDFYPAEYRMHFTGRTRAPQSGLHQVLPRIEALIAQTIAEAQEASVRLYAESELVREIRHFSGEDVTRSLAALDGIALRKSRGTGAAKADVHVEFRSGTVPDEVRSLLLDRRFYWVRTPASQRFPSEEIATLQTSTFHDAQQVYDRLVAMPLPACTGIHLEQKLAMIPSHAALPMPGVVELIPD
jgi:hypothetical protein